MARLPGSPRLARLLCALVAGGFGVACGLDAEADAPQRPVPWVEGMSLRQAERRLEREGFRWRFDPAGRAMRRARSSSGSRNARYARRRVIRQSPGAGTPQALDAPVLLRVQATNGARGRRSGRLGPPQLRGGRGELVLEPSPTPTPRG